jgi:hypothetical protein
VKDFIASGTMDWGFRNVEMSDDGEEDMAADT